MAITTRALITSPAVAAVAAWTVLGLSLFVSQFNVSSPDPTTPYACSTIAENNGPESSQWSAFGWMEYSNCIDQWGDSQRAAGIARFGTQFHPTHEGLVNYAGILSIKAQDYASAVDILSDGTKRIQPTSGTMHNNLVWASLYTNSHHTDVLRHWNQASLRLNPNSCELLHTGLMVEWRRASEAQSGFQLNSAVKAFTAMYQRYESCPSRSVIDEESVLAEQVTALVAVAEVDALIGVHYNAETRRDLAKIAPRVKQSDASAQTICREIPTTLNNTTCYSTVRALLSGNPL